MLKVDEKAARGILNMRQIEESGPTLKRSRCIILKVKFSTVLSTGQRLGNAELSMSLPSLESRPLRCSKTMSKLQDAMAMLRTMVRTHIYTHGQSSGEICFFIYTSINFFHC